MSFSFRLLSETRTQNGTACIDRLNQIQTVSYGHKNYLLFRDMATISILLVPDSPDISADGGVLHALWWDSRNDPCYSPTRPIGNCADRTAVQSLDVWATTSSDFGSTSTSNTRITDVSSNGNY